LREAEVATGGREEVDDDSVLRRSLVGPEAGALVGRLLVVVVIRFERPFWAVFLLSSPEVRDMLPSVSDAAVFEDEVVGRRTVEVEADGRVGGFPRPNAVRDVVDGVLEEEEAIGDRVVAVVGLAAVEPPSRFGAVEVDAEPRFTGAAFSALFLEAIGDAGDESGDGSTGATSGTSFAVGALS
jgi:hypothetical protein